MILKNAQKMAAKSLFFGTFVGCVASASLLTAHFTAEIKKQTETKTYTFAPSTFAWIGQTKFGVAEKKFQDKPIELPKIVFVRKPAFSPVQQIAATTTPPAPKDSTEATENEKATLRSIHKLLKQNFKVALEQPAEDLPHTELAIQPPTQTPKVTIVPSVVEPAKIQVSKPVSVTSYGETLDSHTTSALMENFYDLERQVDSINDGDENKEFRAERIVASRREPTAVLTPKPREQQQTLPPQHSVLITLNGSAAAKSSRQRALDLINDASLNSASLYKAIKNQKKSVAVASSKGFDQVSSLQSDASAPAREQEDTASEYSKCEYPFSVHEVFAADDISDQLSIQQESTNGFAESNAGGWTTIEGDGYLSTIAYSNPCDSTNQGKVLSKNSARFFERLAGADQNGEAGLLYGIVRKDWRVDFSGRSDAPLFVNVDGLNRVAPEDVSNDRYFFFFNAAPGAHILYFKKSIGPKNSSYASGVGVPVLAQKVTYIELTEPKVIPILGRVLNGSNSPDPQAVANDDNAVAWDPYPKSQVRVAGSSSLVAQTDQQGFFRINEVPVFGNYPIFLDVESASQYKHRFIHLPSTQVPENLFVFSNEQLKDWIGQLSGGLSSESSIVVSAVPQAYERFPNDPLYPTVENLDSHASLQPETYALSDSGQLLVHSPLEKDRPRFVSVQIPEGFSKVSLSTTEGKAVWSHWIVSQPGVINVLGP